MTASYVGISETMIHFVIYERIKKWLREQRAYNTDLLSPKDFLTFMGAAATSKSIAATIAYPHGEFSRHPNDFSRRTKRVRRMGVSALFFFPLFKVMNLTLNVIV